MFEVYNLRSDFKEFLRLYKNKPIKDNFSGIKIEHAFALHSILKKIKPKYIIESGVFKGMSTWIIEKTLPQAEIFCIEPNLDKIEYKAKNAKYFSQDITNINFDFLNKKETLVFFDDHVCLSERLDYLENNKFKKIIFDDNLPSEVIGYITPKAIMSERFEKSKIRIPYRYISRLLKNLLFFYLRSNYYKKVNFTKNFCEFERENYSEHFKQKLLEKKKFISNYVEFPPLVKFDYKKKFQNQISRYNLDYSDVLKNVPSPIFDNIDEDLINYKDELSYQYGCMCYFEYY